MSASLTPIREFWTKIQILGIELASFLDKKSNKNYKIPILGFELASFLDKKSRPFFRMFTKM